MRPSSNLRSVLGLEHLAHCSVCVCVCVCVCARARVCAQLCPTLYDSTDCSHQAPLSMGPVEWATVSSSRGSFQPKHQNQVFMFPALADRFFTTEPPGISGLQKAFEQASPSLSFILPSILRSFPNLYHASTLLVPES